MAEVHYSSLAAKDLAENAEYIAKDKPDAAYRWIDTIESVCALLAANPELGELREVRGYGHCRSFASGNYVIFYRAAPDGVDIVRILRAERDIDNI